MTVMNPEYQPVTHLFKRLSGNKEQTLHILQTSLDNLENVGIVPFLRAKGNIQLFHPGAKNREQAAKAAFSAGYHEALDDLMYFVQRFITPGEDAASMHLPSLDYGATKRLLNENKITTEEAEFLKGKRQ
jgi:hypothetical protein